MDKRREKRGLTLTELLVVVAIVVLVAGAMVPIMQPVIKGQTTKEASKVVSEVFFSAQTRAISRKQRVGVWIERAAPEIVAGQESKIYTAYKLYMAQQPKPYSGDLKDVRVGTAPAAVVKLPPPPYVNVTHVRYAFAPMLSLAGSLNIVSVGDEIRFDYRDEWYPIVDVFPRTGPPYAGHPIDVNDDGTPDIPDAVVYTYMDPTGKTDKYFGQQIPFQILRKPKKTAAPPVEMPNGTAIDLSVSGMEGDLLAKFRYPRQFYPGGGDPGNYGLPEVSPEHDIVIMFGPGGEPDRVYYTNSVSGFQSLYCSQLRTQLGVGFLPHSRQVMGPIHLMIARDELIGWDPANNRPNVLTGNMGSNNSYTLDQLNGYVGEASLRETANIWLTITANQIKTTPNAGFIGNLNMAAAEPQKQFYLQLQNARQLTKKGR